MNIKIEVDGEILDVKVLNNVKIIVEGLGDKEDNEDFECHINVNEDGIIKDVIDNNSYNGEDVVSTQCLDFIDLKVVTTNFYCG